MFTRLNNSMLEMLKEITNVNVIDQDVPPFFEFSLASDRSHTNIKVVISLELLKKIEKANKPLSSTVLDYLHLVYIDNADQFKNINTIDDFSVAVNRVFYKDAEAGYKYLTEVFNNPDCAKWREGKRRALMFFMTTEDSKEHVVIQVGPDRSGWKQKSFMLPHLGDAPFDIDVNI